jgi:COP9 signalosome complex subunit 3
MSGDLLNVLLHFQPDSLSIKSNRDYDQAARSFVSQLSNISPSHWSKAADTPQDVLVVGI